MLESDTRLTETCVKPQKREVHIKSAFEFSHLEKFSKCWDQMQGSIKPTFNKQTQAQADEAEVINPRLAYQCKSHI